MDCQNARAINATPIVSRGLNYNEASKVRDKRSGLSSIDRFSIGVSTFIEEQEEEDCANWDHDRRLASYSEQHLGFGYGANAASFGVQSPHVQHRAGLI